jgi:hypothetical protein
MLGIAALIWITASTRGAVTEAWMQLYNGPANSYDSVSAVVVDRSGNVIVTGSSNNGTNTGYLTIKYAAADGSLIWKQRSSGGGTPLALAVDAIGNVIVTGRSTNDDYYTVKYAATNGAVLWERRNEGRQANAVAVDRGGNVVVTGSSYNGTNSDIYTVKYGAVDGALIWGKRYNGPANGGDEAMAVTVDGADNVIVTGSSQNESDYDDYYTAKYAAADGALLWETRYVGENDGGSAYAVGLDSSGNVFVTGTAEGIPALDEQNDFYTAKYAAATGALLWERRYDGPTNAFGLRSDDEGRALVVDGNGDVIVTGSVEPAGGDEYARSFYTAKYAGADGALLWEKSHKDPADNDDYATGIALDAAGNVIVTGISQRAPQSGFEGDSYTAKYATADGALLWEKRYSYFRGRNGDDSGGLSVASDGAVVVAGTSLLNPAGKGDFATIVYRENLLPVSIAPVSGGTRLRFHGVASHGYNIERAPNVTGPWSTNATLTASTNGIIEYVDTNAPPTGSAFYRTSTP